MALMVVTCTPLGTHLSANPKGLLGGQRAQPHIAGEQVDVPLLERQAAIVLDHIVVDRLHTQVRAVQEGVPGIIG